ncbi:hypothetical protein ABD86_25435 [Paenibacillus alvei]|nr:hypothetical protein [Paenibacillus alvei]MBG9747113.1 hypothetical protein [Paenibacillus alvei]
MAAVIVFAIIIGAIVAIPIGIKRGNRDWKEAKEIECPVCGNEFRLIRGSYKCPKCRKRIVQATDGKIKSV